MMISGYLAGLAFKLLTGTHSSTMFSSACRLLALVTGMMMYLLLVNLAILFIPCCDYLKISCTDNM